MNTKQTVVMWPRQHGKTEAASIEALRQCHTAAMSVAPPTSNETTPFWTQFLKELRARGFDVVHK